MSAISVENPFFLTGPAQICFSGGRTSGKLLHEVLQAHKGVLPNDVKVCFENTGKEIEPTLLFIEEVSQRWSVPIVWLEWDDTFRIENYTKANGELSERHKSWGPGDWGFRIVDFKTASRKGEPFRDMLRYYADYRRTVKSEGPLLPNVTRRMCTAYLKIKVGSRYMKSIGFDEYDAIMGIRYDEPKRWTKMFAQNQKGTEPYVNVLPLYAARITKADVQNFWSLSPFDLGIDAQSYQGNCDNCFLKSYDKLISLMRVQISNNKGVVPDNLQWWADTETWAGQRFRKDRPGYEELIQIALSGEKIEIKDEAIVDCICGE